MADTEPTAVQLTICPYGDLILSLQTPEVNLTYLVSSHQLCCASPVFRASLGPSSGFLEAIDLRHSQTAGTTVSDDPLYEMPIGEGLKFDPTAMAVVLYVIHRRPDQIPESIEFENLLDIAVICDYYDCAPVMSPLDKAWIQPFEKHALEPEYEDLLFAAYVFGKQELFAQITKAFARKGVTTEDGEFGVMVGGEVRKMHCHLPEGITRDMATHRAMAGKGIAQLCRQPYDIYSNNSTVKCRCPREHCDNIVFGFLYMDLAELGLLSIEKEDNEQPDVHSSKTLDNIISDFTNSWNTIRQNLGNVTTGGQNHTNCIESTEEQVKKFDPWLDSIASLTITSYAKSTIPTGDVTWDVMLGRNRKPRDITRPESFDKHDIYLEICPYGDLEIGYCSVGTTFLVSSHALRTASPVFRDLLGSTSAFVEHSCRHNTQDSPSNSKDDTMQRYRFEVDTVYDPTLLAVVFYAFHGLGNKIPDDIDFPNLYALAVVCENYSCASIVLPWCQNWVDKLRCTIETPGDGGWLYVAWVFGLDDIFQSLTRKLATGAFITSNEREVTLEGHEVVKKLGEYIPQRVIDEIKAQESRARQNIAEGCTKVYERYCNPSGNECFLPSHKGADKLYDRMVFAELNWGFKAIKLLKRNAIEVPSDIPVSSVAQDIIKLLNDTTLKVFHAKVGSGNQYACTCDLWDARRKIEIALDEIKPLNLAMFERENSRVSWELMLPGVSGWVPEPEPELELEPEPEPEPEPDPKPRPEHKSKHYYEPDTYEFEFEDYDEPDPYEFEAEDYDEPDPYEFEAEDYDEPDLDYGYEEEY
ncbi:hypothetical protein BDD12DRAFT_912349 [Trichophaea hybrida]|nr:hypothetical protein BDD12DRAFT_912349 [Trichophaea hybrida]